MQTHIMRQRNRCKSRHDDKYKVIELGSDRPLHELATSNDSFTSLVLTSDNNIPVSLPLRSQLRDTSVVVVVVGDQQTFSA